MSDPTLEDLTKFFNALSYLKSLKSTARDVMSSYMASLYELKANPLYSQYVGVDDAESYDILKDNIDVFIQNNFPSE